MKYFMVYAYRFALFYVCFMLVLNAPCLDSPLNVRIRGYKKINIIIIIIIIIIKRQTSV